MLATCRRSKPKGSPAPWPRAYVPRNHSIDDRSIQDPQSMYPLPRRQNHRLGSRSHDALARDLSLDHPLIRDHRVARTLLCEVSNLSRTASREPPRTTGVTPGARVPRPSALFAKAGYLCSPSDAYHPSSRSKPIPFQRCSLRMSEEKESTLSARLDSLSPDTLPSTSTGIHAHDERTPYSEET